MAISGVISKASEPKLPGAALQQCTLWVDLQGAFADCLEDAVYGAVTVVVEEHRHPAERSCCISTLAEVEQGDTDALANLPRNNVLHIADMGPR